ncbi:MAG TPA: response regulator, partial [Thermoanaerobaculia bacterium]
EVEHDAATLRTRLAEVKQLAAARTEDAVTLRAQLAEREEEAGTLRAQLTALEELAGARAAEAETLRARVGELEEDAAASHLESSALQSRVVAFEREASSREMELAALREQLATAASAVSAREEEVDVMRTRIAQLENGSTSAAAESEKMRAHIEALEQQAAFHAEYVSTAIARVSETHAEATALRARVTELEQHAAARDAEVMALQTRASEFEQLANTYELQSTAAQERIVQLQSDLAAERESFDQKLNTIVVHLAHDHEADLGKALEEKEEARAEARSLAMRLAALQKKIDDERQALEGATRLLTDVRAAAQQEIDRLHLRIAELEKPAAPAEATTARPRVLIAHPDADLRMNARASLERAGYEIVSAADGLEALRTAIAQRPAVVIADAIMPKMDGRELCQLLKSQEKTAHIRVILLMRVTDDAPKGDLLPDEVLRKPVPLETLKATLAGLLAARA